MAPPSKAPAERSSSKKLKSVSASGLAWGAPQEKQASTSTGAGLVPVDPRTVGIDPATLRGYEQTMKEMVRQGAIPGCASVVIRHGQIVQVGSWGHADLERGTRFGLNTLCRLYCMTKSYVAATFMSLVDDGVVGLEDRLDKYLPAFAHVRVRVHGTGESVRPRIPIRMKHLISHTSGIDYPPDIGTEPETAAQESYVALHRAVQQGSVRSLKAFVERLAKLPLSNHPGERYYYGFSMDVLARVLEVVMGKSLDKCLRERLFDPLGMKDTLWAVPNSELHRLAACYASATTWGNLYGGAKGQKPITPRNGLVRIDGNRREDSGWRQGRQCSVLSGGGFMGYLQGGLVSTVEDTVRFVQMLVSRGVSSSGQRILKEATLRVMEKKRLKASWKSGQACYLGNVGVFREGGAEFGMGGAACTYWSVDRTTDVATVWFTQHVDMPEFEELSGVDPAKADLWQLLHKAVLKGVKGSAGGKRQLEAQQGGSAKRRRSSKSS